MRVVIFAVSSLFIHLAFVLLLQEFPADYFLAKELEKNAGIEVEIVNQPQELTQQVVRQADAPENQLDDLKEQAKYLSEQAQRVLVQTRARKTGITKNRVPQPQFLQDALEEKSRQLASEDGDEIREDSKLQKQARRDLYEVGPSTMGDSLPEDMAVGSFTALNTDKFTYYSFFARIEDLIRFRWESRVTEATQSFDRAYVVQVIGRKSWNTQIEFLLDPQGEFVKARILKSSGMFKYDQAPILAFKEARYFPNPPQELVRDDGFIHLVYSFQVNFNPGWMAHR
ncbi:MAG: TonB C-terminal domain-containing protein [Bdellovibrionota bacterium]